MSKNKKDKRTTNADFRAKVNMPAPEVKEIEEELMKMINPGSFVPLRMASSETIKLRERILTLPVMVAIVVSIVYRQIPSLSEVLRILKQEGLLWVGAIKVSKQALSARLERLPASLFAEVFNEVLANMPVNKKQVVGKQWQELRARFSEIYLADGSTLEALRKKAKEIKEIKEEGTVLAGKMMMVVEAFSKVPIKAWYEENEKANDKNWCKELIELLPIKGLLVMDMGFFSFGFFDQITEAGKYFVTRLREKTAYKVWEVLSQGTHYRDEIIEMGIYRSNPCKEKVRLVSVLWGTTWYRYLTNVLDPQLLSAKEVCDLYRRRWTIEEAFLLTKRLLGLAYLWVGQKNGAEIQIYSTWIFYTILVRLCADVAFTLSQPIERISVEMVFRSLYHVSRARQRGDFTPLVDYICNDFKLFGLVKSVRKRSRERDSFNFFIWGIA